MAGRVWLDAESVTARFRMPGEPAENLDNLNTLNNTVQYRIENRGLARELLSLTGGGSAEERRGSARYAAGTAWLQIAVQYVPQLDGPVRQLELRGPDAARFRVEEMAGAAVERDIELLEGFAVT